MGAEAAADMVLSPYERAGGPSVKFARQVKPKCKIAASCCCRWRRPARCLAGAGLIGGGRNENDRKTGRCAGDWRCRHRARDRGDGVPQDLFDRLHTRIPSSLLRSLDPDFFFGIHSFNQNNPVLIFTTTDYQNAYAGILSWEKAMPNDIGGLFASPTVSPSTSGTSTATTTLPVFQDKVITNKDTRALVDSTGKTLFFYSFVDQNTLIFTTSASTFGEVISRLTKPKLVH